MKKELLTKTLKQLIKDMANEKYQQERNGMAQAALNLIDEKEILANEVQKPDSNCNIQHVVKSVCGHPKNMVYQVDNKQFCEKCNSWLEF